MWGLDGNDERLSFGKEIRRQAEYGTSSSSKPSGMKRDETKYLKHAVVPGDTLQGLSLKYNVPVRFSLTSEYSRMNTVIKIVLCYEYEH